MGISSPVGNGKYAIYIFELNMAHIQNRLAGSTQTLHDLLRSVVPLPRFARVNRSLAFACVCVCVCARAQRMFVYDSR